MKKRTIKRLLKSGILREGDYLSCPLKGGGERAAVGFFQRLEEGCLVLEHTVQPTIEAEGHKYRHYVPVGEISCLTIRGETIRREHANDF